MPQPSGVADRVEAGALRLRGNLIALGLEGKKKLRREGAGKAQDFSSTAPDLVAEGTPLVRFTPFQWHRRR